MYVSVHIYVCLHVSVGGGTCTVVILFPPTQV